MAPAALLGASLLAIAGIAAVMVVGVVALLTPDERIGFAVGEASCAVAPDGNLVSGG